MCLLGRLINICVYEIKRTLLIRQSERIKIKIRKRYETTIKLCKLRYSECLDADDVDEAISHMTKVYHGALANEEQNLSMRVIMLSHKHRTYKS